MAFTPDQPFPKSRGDMVRSKDWNDAVNELLRLDRDKVNKAGDAMTGPLTIAGNLGIGTTSPSTGLHIGSGVPGGQAGIRLENANGQSGQISRWTNRLEILASDEVHLATGAVGNTRLSVKSDGDVGIGTTNPQARLSVVASGAGEIVGTAQSPTFRTSAGSLGTAEGSELSLASIGFLSGNNTSLGIRAYRFAAGDNWMTAAIGLGIDVDDTVRVNGTSLWLNPSGYVGIGTTGPIAKLQVAGGAIMPSAGNTEQSGILFPPDPGGGSADRAWIRYYARQGEDTTLEIGVSNDPQDHIALMASGGVGIGTTNPTHRFHVVAAEAVGLFESTGTQAFLRLSTNEGLNNRVELTNRPGGRLSLWTAGAGDVFNITRAGNVGIGTTSPLFSFHQAGGDHVIEDADVSLRRSGMHRWRIQSVPAGFMIHQVYNQAGQNANSDRLVISDAGKVSIGGGAIINGVTIGTLVTDPDFPWPYECIGMAQAGYNLRLHSQGGIYFHPGNSHDALFHFLANGTALKSGGGLWGAISDITLKKNISPLEEALDKLLQLRGVTFEWKEPEKHGNLTGIQIGLVAQEVEKAFPEWVGETPDGLKYVSITGFEALVVEALRKLEARVKTLEAR